MSEPTPRPSATLYDVVEVSFDQKDVRVMAERKSFTDAEAIISMAVMRRGVESSYFTMRPTLWDRSAGEGDK